jgi:DNA processing protein
MVDPSQYSMAAQILALKMTGQVGPRTFDLLMAVYRTVGEILLAEEQEFMEFPGIGPKRSEALAKAHTHLDKAREIIDGLESEGTGAVTRLDPEFPEILQELNDPPLILYYRGTFPPQDEKRVAVIGSQDVSAEGIGDAVEFSKNLAKEGIGIVGGLARGIDTAGHMGALKENGVTYAVLPCGFNRIHPAENEALTKEIIERGCLLSEYLPDTPVSSGRLMSRNRLIVGLSHAVVVGEVSPESVGTLDATLCCHELGKLLFLIVGTHNPHYEKLAGHGAIPLTTIDNYKMVFRALV